MWTRMPVSQLPLPQTLMSTCSVSSTVKVTGGGGGDSSEKSPKTQKSLPYGAPSLQVGRTWSLDR